MSQEKVARYKEEKANRKKILKKEKQKRILRNCAMSVVVVAIVGWIGYSSYSAFASSRPRHTVEVDYNEFETYLQGLTAEETE